MAVPSAALARLPQYNDGPYNPSTNPYGLDSNGYIVNFPLAASDIAEVAGYMAEAAETVTDLGPQIAALGAVVTQMNLLAPLAANGNIQALAAITSQMTALAGIASNITAVAGNAANINAAVSNAANISAVASAIANVNAVAAGLTNIASVVSNIAAITNVAGKLTEITTVSGAASAVQTVSTNIANVNTVAGANSAIATVAGIAGNVTTVAGVASQLASVAANAVAIGTVGDNVASVNTAANNIAAIQAAPTAASTATGAAAAAANSAAAAKRVALFSEFDVGTADANPGPGCWRINHASPTAATLVFISTTAKSGGDIASWLDTWDDSNNPGHRGELTFVNAVDAGTWLKVAVVGSNVVASGYYKIAISYVDHAGTFADAVDFSVDFKRTGNQGNSGAGTGTLNRSGSTGDGRFAAWDGANSDLLKDSGYSFSSFATAAQGALAGTALQPGALDNTVQRYDPLLFSLAGLTTSANTIIYATGPDAFTTTGFTAAARDLLDDGNAADMRSTLGLVIGTHVQAQNANLSAFAGLTGAADRVAYFTGAGTLGLTTITAAARNLLDDADAAAMRGTLGLGTAATSAAGDFAPAAHVGSGGSAHANVVAGGAAGFMTGVDKTKLDGIATGATANSGDAYLLALGNHTGSLSISQVTNLQSTLDGKEPADSDIAKVDVAKTWTAAQQFGQVAGTVTAVAALNLDCSLGNEFTKTIAANSTFTVAMVPASKAYDLRLILSYTSGTITWFAGVNWVKGTAPTFTGGKKYEIIFSTQNGGTTWRAASGEYAA